MKSLFKKAPLQPIPEEEEVEEKEPNYVYTPYSIHNSISSSLLSPYHIESNEFGTFYKTINNIKFRSNAMNITSDDCICDWKFKRIKSIQLHIEFIASMHTPIHTHFQFYYLLVCLNKGTKSTQFPRLQDLNLIIEGNIIKCSHDISILNMGLVVLNPLHHERASRSIEIQSNKELQLGKSHSIQLICIITSIESIHTPIQGIIYGSYSFLTHDTSSHNTYDCLLKSV